jgi:hypothetical protein
VLNGIADPWHHPIGGLAGYTRWAFDYSQGFTKRGFVGEIFRLIDPQLSLVDVQVVYFALLFFVSVLLVSYYYFHLDSFSDYDLIFFSAWGITCVGTLQQYSHDITRFDIFGAFFIITGTYLIIFFSVTYLRIIIFLFFSLTSILIHEAFFLWVFPSLLFSLFFLEEDLPLKYVFIFVLFVALFTLHVGTSVPHSDSPSSFISALSETTSFKLFEFRTHPMYSTLFESIKYNYSKLDLLEDTFAASLSAVCFSFVLYPCLYALCSFSHNLSRRYYIIYLLFIFCTFLPLSLYLVGFDHGRWWAMSMTSFSVLFVLILKGPHESQIRHEFRSNIYLVVLGISLNLILGPVGKFGLFPKSYIIRVVDTILG